MSQKRYDVCEFVLENKKEILSHLNSETKDLKRFESLFLNSPEIFEEFYTEALQRQLIYQLIPMFHSNFEEMSEIIDKEFLLLVINENKIHDNG